MSTKSTKKITSNLLSSLWEYLKKALRSRLITSAVKRLLGSGALGGIKGMIIMYVAGHLYDEIIVPFLDFLERKGMLYYDKSQGRIKSRNLEKAKEAHDEDAYNRTVDSI